MTSNNILKDFNNTTHPFLVTNRQDIKLNTLDKILINSKHNKIESDPTLLFDNNNSEVQNKLKTLSKNNEIESHIQIFSGQSRGYNDKLYGMLENNNKKKMELYRKIYTGNSNSDLKIREIYERIQKDKIKFNSLNIITFCYLLYLSYSYLNNKYTYNKYQEFDSYLQNVKNKIGVNTEIDNKNNLFHNKTRSSTWIGKMLTLKFRNNYLLSSFLKKIFLLKSKSIVKSNVTIILIGFNYFYYKKISSLTNVINEYYNEKVIN